MSLTEKIDSILFNSEDKDDMIVQNLKITSLAVEGSKVASKVEIFDSKVNTIAAHNNALEKNWITSKGRDEILTADNETLKRQMTTVEGRRQQSPDSR